MSNKDRPIVVAFPCSKQVEKRAEVVDAFLAAFQLSPAETRALRGEADGAVLPPFFPALRRAREIHADCKRLLADGQHVAACVPFELSIYWHVLWYCLYV